MKKPEEDEKLPVKGALQDRWSLLSILKRVGLSKKYMGEEGYNKLIAKANESARGTINCTTTFDPRGRPHPRPVVDHYIHTWCPFVRPHVS